MDFYLKFSFCIHYIVVTEDCQFTCPELFACVNASIWCDGRVHCPSGYDESFVHCSRILRLPAEVLAVVSVILLLLSCAGIIYVHRLVQLLHVSLLSDTPNLTNSFIKLKVLYLNFIIFYTFFSFLIPKKSQRICRKIKNHCQRSSVLQTRLKSLSSMDTAVFDEKDFIS